MTTTRGHDERRAIAALLAALLALAWAWTRSRRPAVPAAPPRQPPLDRPPPPGDLRLSVVIPAYRERERIAGAVTSVRETLAPLVAGGDLEIVVVDDGSGDGTAHLAKEAGADQVIELPVNRGKGAGVRAGVFAARGRSIVFTDADLSYSPVQILRLLTETEAGWDVVIGNRRHAETATLAPNRPIRELSGRVFNLAASAVLQRRYRDTQCGLKAFRSDAARELFRETRIDRFAFDVEILHLAERHRCYITEVPVELTNALLSSVRLGPDALQMAGDLVRLWWRARRTELEHVPVLG
jgi:dolichyl-phosphate beta-glucosyltransferase